MAHYDANTNNIHDLYDHLGISRSDLVAATGNLQTLNSNMGTYSWGLTPHFGAARGEGSYVVRTSQGSARTSTIDLTTSGAASHIEHSLDIQLEPDGLQSCLTAVT